MNKTAENKIEEQDIDYIHRKAARELRRLEGKSVLITGANGFLGFYFIKSIISWNAKTKNKIKVTALSTYRNGIPKWLLDLSKKNKELKLLKKDISIYKIPQKLNFDYIIHAASIASPTYYRKYPVVTINANVMGMYKVLNYSISRPGNKKILGILYFSSSEIYGDPTPGNIPTPETYRGNVSCTGPRACYDESKRFCETLAVNYSKQYKLPIKIARPFNNYGPGLRIDDGRVIPDLSRNILDGKDITLFSDGSPSRTFCYITDAIVGYYKVLIKGKNGEAYNIGVDSEEITIFELAKKIQNIAKKEFGYKGKIVNKKNKDKAYLTDNPNRRRPMIDKARKELGYSPSVRLINGLSNSLSWYKEIYYS